LPDEATIWPEGYLRTADRNWHLHAFRLLKMLCLIQTDDICELEIGANNTSIVRDADFPCLYDEKWQIVTPPLVYQNDWRRRLIRQNDGFSCGRIAILHVLKLLGEEIEVQYEANPMECIPDTRDLTLNLLRPDWKHLFGQWLRDTARIASSPPNRSSFYEFYVEGKSIGDVEDFVPVIHEEAAVLLGASIDADRRRNDDCKAVLAAAVNTESTGFEDGTGEVQYVPVCVEVEDVPTKERSRLRSMSTWRLRKL
jgi:hypothetical protein